MSFIGELQRRNVVRVGVAYVVTSWFLLQVADTLLETMGTPDWVMRALLTLLMLGFLPVLIFAWAFELTPEGIKPEREVQRDVSITHHTARKLDITTIGMLLAIGGFMIWDSSQREITEPQAEVVATAPADSAEKLDRTTTGDALDKSIAVLPFVNLSSDPEQEYFSDGISEELLNVLAQVPELRVAARTSSFQFKGDNRDISEIAELLKVDHVLEGSVRKAGTRLRITAQLIEAENGYHLWSDTYDRELNDVFAIQDEISAAIGEALKRELGINEAAALQAPRVAETANTAAYEAYLKGRYFVNQRGNRAIAEAVRELEKSIRLDPNFAPAQAQLAIAIALSSSSPSTYGDLTIAQVNTRANPHADAAMKLNPDMAEAWGALSILASANGDWEDSIEHAKRALELNPVYTDALNWIQTSALRIGNYGEADWAIEKLMEVDPLSVVGRVNYLGNHLAVLNPESAHEQALALAEQHKWAGYAALSNIARAQGKVAESLYWVLQAYAYDPLDRFSNGGIVNDFCDLGLPDEARRVSDVTLSMAEWQCGDIDRALELLDREVAMDPDDPQIRGMRLSVLYWRGDKAEALKGYRESAEARGAKPMIGGGYGLWPHIEYTWLLQQSGNADQASVEIKKMERDLASRAGTRTDRYGSTFWNRGQIALLKGDRELALDYMERAIDQGLRVAPIFDAPELAELAENPRFQALRTRMDELLEEERKKALQMICFDNPVPESWQPLAATCAGVMTASVPVTAPSAD